MKRVLRLARWLGPWTPEGRRPLGLRRERVRVEGPRPFDAWVHHPRGEATGALLVVPGLHYAGPADPRLDRFLAILADAGILTLCPFLPDFRALRVAPTLLTDAERALDALLAHPERPRAASVRALSISFGSHPALHLGARPEVDALVLFGGYASFEDAIRFAIEGEEGRPHDPLNVPVVMLNILDALELADDERARLASALETYVRCTWGRPEMKERTRHEPVARKLAKPLPERARELFLVGCGIESGAKELVDDALSRLDFSFLDPRPTCARVRCPVTIVHGRDDDVIPFSHASRLAEMLPADVRCETWLTGLYGHTSQGALDLREAAAEGRAMWGILRALAG